MQKDNSNKENNEVQKKMSSDDLARKLADDKYKYGFTTDVDTDIIERGLNEDIIRLISSKKGEPEWLLDIIRSCTD